jgi:DNA-binding transcriptional MerR regulator
MEVNMIELMTIGDLSRLIDVTVTRIEYAEAKGRLPEPKRWHGRKVYTMADTDLVRTYFKGLKPWHKVKEGGK